MQRCMGCMEMMEDAAVTCPLCGYVKGSPQKEAYHMQTESILGARYIVGRVLGFGGFGVTYIGWDAQLERKVAIKEFLPSSFATRMPGYTEITVYGGEATLQFEAGLSRFTEEAKRLAGFNSVPGIVDIYDTFVENNTAYIAMQFLQGEDVKQRLAREGNFSFEEALPIIVNICETLSPVHKEGIIHRDIAPDNIYITKAGEVKLLDFGASRFATSVNSKSLSVILKSGYAPEEQYRSKGDQGSWSDVYALAATFYKMLTGVTPEDSMERAIKDELREPSQHGAVLPKDAENAIMNALNIRKENRTQTVEEFQKALTGDRVARVKEKAMRSDTGSLPLWGKIAIFGSLAVVLLFGLLTVTGVVDFGQGNLLADTFGSGVPKGQVNAPGVVNQMEEKAQKSVKKAGLAYLIVGTRYSDDIEKGRILSQDPLPGRLIAIGSELQVNISGGSRAEATASGEIALPDLTYMNMQQAAYELNQAGYQARVNYEYSDTVAEGLVMSYREGYVTELVVSAGKDDADKEAGAIRTPSMYVNQNGTTVLEIAVASARVTTGGEQERIRHQFYYTMDDGATWQPLQETNSSSVSNHLDNYHVNEWQKVPTFTLSLDAYTLNKHIQFSGKTVRFKVERWWDDEFHNRDNTEGGSYIDRAEFTQRFSPVIEGEEVTVEGFEKLTWEEMGKVIEKNNHMEQSAVGYQYKRIVEEGEEAYSDPVRLTGNFKAGTEYRAVTDHYDLFGSGDEMNLCYEDGVLYLDTYRLQDGQWENGQLSLAVWKAGQATVAENGDISTKLAPSATTHWKTGVKQESITGKTMYEVLEQEKAQGLNRYMRVSYGFSEENQEGTVVKYIGDEWNMEITVGAGSEEEKQEAIMRGAFLYPSNYGDITASCTLWPMPAEDDYYSINLLASPNGGSSYEQIGYGSGVYHGDELLQEQTASFELGELTEEEKWKDIPITLKLELLNEDNQVIESKPLPGTVTYHLEEPVGVTAVKEIPVSDLDRYRQEGRITTKNSRVHSLYDNYQTDPSYVENDRVYLLTGSFEKGQLYYVKAVEENSSGETEAVCETAGEIFLNLYDFRVEEKIQMEVIKREFSVDEQGNIIMDISRPQDILSLF